MGWFRNFTLAEGHNLSRRNRPEGYPTDKKERPYSPMAVWPRYDFEGAD